MDTEKVWRYKKDEQEREEYLNSIIQSESWIIEGVHNEVLGNNSFHNADMIIFLDTRYSIRTIVYIKRFIKQKLRLEKSNYKPTFKMFLKMFKWNRISRTWEKLVFSIFMADIKTR